MAVPIVPIIWGASALSYVLSTIYNAWREKPDVKMAEHLRALQLEAVGRKQTELEVEEETRGRYAQLRSQRLGDLVQTKQGLDSGYISPASLGITGGGLAARDLPMVNLMAARMGMDPQDLVARFDPTRSNAWVPRSRRGNTPRPTPQQLARPGGAPEDAVQLTPRMLG